MRVPAIHGPSVRNGDASLVVMSLRSFVSYFCGATCTKPASVLGLVQTKPFASTPSAFCPPFKIISGRLHTKPGERFSRPSCRSSSTHSRGSCGGSWLLPACGQRKSAAGRYFYMCNFELQLHSTCAAVEHTRTATQSGLQSRLPLISFLPSHTSLHPCSLLITSRNTPDRLDSLQPAHTDVSTLQLGSSFSETPDHVQSTTH